MKKTTLFLAAAGLAVISAGCSNEAETNAQGEKQTIHFYTSQPDADAQALVEEFTALYPNIEVETYRSGTEEVISKMQAEKQAGNIQADVLLVADAVTFEGLKEQNWLEPYDSPEANAIPETFIDADGMYTGTKVMATALAVNTKKVTGTTDSWNVLTGEQAKNSAVMPSPLYSGAAAYNLGVMTRQDDFGWDFYKQLKQNGMAVTQGNGGVLEAVASGEKAYGMVVDFLVVRAQKDGSPVELIYPKEGVPVITEPIGIINGTEEKAAAQAFVDFVLSEQGQTLAAELGYTPIRKGVKAPEGLKTLDEMTVLTSDSASLYKDREEDKQQFGTFFSGQ